MHGAAGLTHPETEDAMVRLHGERRVQRSTRPARPQIMRAVGQVGTFDVSGRKCRCTVYVKTGSKRLTHDFWHTCQRYGIRATEVQTWDYLTAFDVIGTEYALGVLSERPCVRNWEFAMSGRTPVIATGSGPEKRAPFVERDFATAEDVKRRLERAPEVHVRADGACFRS
jgi:hypothetical protein